MARLFWSNLHERHKIRRSIKSLEHDVKIPFVIKAKRWTRHWSAPTERLKEYRSFLIALKKNRKRVRALNKKKETYNNMLFEFSRLTTPGQVDEKGVHDNRETAADIARMDKRFENLKKFNDALEYRILQFWRTRRKHPK